jgi:Protein prenyltransferase alpha subunit repeat
VLEGDGRTAAAEMELQLVEQCLQKNHKSYSAWHHRQWIVEHGTIDLDKELEVAEKCVPRFWKRRHVMWLDPVLVCKLLRAGCTITELLANDSSVATCVASLVIFGLHAGI